MTVGVPERVRAAMNRLRLGWVGELGVVAVSGGADSVALLRALVECGAKVVVGHVNHQLRGNESDGDEQFVVDLVNSLGIPVRTHRVNVAALGGNVESTARRVRYEWLASVASELGANWIATGHTADDQAETVLHRLIRGTGLQGLRGIAAVRSPRPSEKESEGAIKHPNSPLEGEVGEERSDEPGGGLVSLTHPPPFSAFGVADLPLKGGGEQSTNPLTPHPSPPGERGAIILRPLLTLPRTDLLDYLTNLAQPFRTDSTNADIAFTRNRIRAELLPLLRTFNPGIVDVLGRLSVQAEELFAEQEVETAELLRAVELSRAGDTLILDAEKLTALGEAKTRRVLRMVWNREGWPVNAMTFDHWRRTALIALGKHPAADFPDGVHVRRAGKVVQLVRRV